MYFVYQKQINVASRQNYDVDSIVEWFQNYIDGDYIKTVYEKDVTAKDIVEQTTDTALDIVDTTSDTINEMISDTVEEAWSGILDVFGGKNTQ